MNYMTPSIKFLLKVSNWYFKIFFLQFSLLLFIKIKNVFSICVSCHPLHDISKTPNYYRVTLRLSYTFNFQTGMGKTKKRLTRGSGKFGGGPCVLPKTEPSTYRQIIQHFYFLLGRHFVQHYCADPERFKRHIGLSKSQATSSFRQGHRGQNIRNPAVCQEHQSKFL